MRRSALADDTRDRIIEGAYRALVRQGYHETTIKDIAQEAGVAAGLVHYYFGSKEDLLVDAIDWGCRQVFDDRQLLDVNPRDAVRLGFEREKQELRQSRELYLLIFDMFGVGLHNPKIAAAVRRFIQQRQEVIAAIARGVITRMKVPPTSSAEAISAAIWGSFFGIGMQRLIDPDFDADAALDALAEMIVVFSSNHRGG